MIRISKRMASLFFLFLCFWVVIQEIRVCKGDEDMKYTWEPFQKWFEWKKKTDLPEKQKEVIDYFDMAGKIKEQLKNNRFDSMTPEVGVRAVKKIINDLRVLKRPEVCNAYYDALLKELQISLEYQEGRKDNLSDEQLQRISLKFLSVDGPQFVSFFQAIKDVGLLNEMEEEMKKQDKENKGK